MKTAMIGLGEIGSILAAQLIERGGIAPGELSLYDRNDCKMEALLKQYPDVRGASGPADAVRGARYVFICVQPPYIPALLQELCSRLSQEANVFISSSNISLAEAEAVTGGKITKFLPTVNSSVGRGVIFAAHNRRVTAGEAAFFKDLMSRLCGRFYEIEESQFAILNNLAGCAPAFIAYFSQCICQAAYQTQTAFPYRELEAIAAETLTATGQRIQEQGLTFDEVISGVGKAGGITYTALSALSECLPGGMEELVRRSVRRHEEVDRAVSDGFRELR